MPISPVFDPDVADGEIFVADTGERFGPVPAPPGRGGAEFIEDIGFVARRPNPLDRERTLTVCSGVFTRGVYGAVRSTTDRRVAAANTGYLRRRFDAEQPFGILMRVLVARTLSPTPRLDDADVRLYEFPCSPLRRPCRTARAIGVC